MTKPEQFQGAHIASARLLAIVDALRNLLDEEREADGNEWRSIAEDAHRTIAHALRAAEAELVTLREVRR